MKLVFLTLVAFLFTFLAKVEHVQKPGNGSAPVKSVITQVR